MDAFCTGYWFLDGYGDSANGGLTVGRVALSNGGARTTTTITMAAASDQYQISIGGGDTDKPLNMRKRLALLQGFVSLRGLRALDCGCGSGGYVLALVELGADAQGVEFSAAKVAQFQQLGRETRRVRQGDLERLEFPDQSLDFALLNEVLEHVPDDRAAVAEVFRVLKPGGRLAVFSPNRLFPFETHGITLKKSGRALPPHFPFVPYVPLALGRRWFRFHARNYFPGELARLLEAAGFRVTRRAWLWQTFENISGRQPGLVRWARPVLRLLANTLERTPGLRRFGVSQVLLAQKPG